MMIRPQEQVKRIFFIHTLLLEDDIVFQFPNGIPSLQHQWPKFIAPYSDLCRSASSRTSEGYPWAAQVIAPAGVIWNTPGLQMTSRALKDSMNLKLPHSYVYNTSWISWGIFYIHRFHLDSTHLYNASRISFSCAMYIAEYRLCLPGNAERTKLLCSPSDGITSDCQSNVAPVDAASMTQNTVTSL